MFPDLEFIKTCLNAITAKFRRVKTDVDAVKTDVDAVKTDVDAVKTDVDAVQDKVDLVDKNATKCLYVKLKDKGQGGYVLDKAPKDIIKHIQSGGNVYIQQDDIESSQLHVIIDSAEPVCLIFYDFTKEYGFRYLVWNTEKSGSFNSFQVSRYLNVTGTGLLRCNGAEITVGSGYMSNTLTMTDWRRSSVQISHNYSESAETYILIDLRSNHAIAGVLFSLAISESGVVEVPFVDYEASDYPSVLVRYVLLHITLLNIKSCHVKEIFYGETLNALEYKPINRMLYCTDNYGFSQLRQFSTSGPDYPNRYDAANNVDVTTFIL